MSKFRPCTVPLKDGRTLLLREGEGADAAQVLSYLNRVGGESDNLLFGQGGFPMPVEREAVFLSRQQQEEKSLMLVGFVGEELACVASCDALTARERVAHRASVSVTVGKVVWALAGKPWRRSSPLPKAAGWKCCSWRYAPTTFRPSPCMRAWALKSWACTKTL